MSAGIPNPCGYIDQPARARLGRMVTAGPSRPAEQPLRLSHNTKSPVPDTVVKAKARAGDGGRRAGDATPAMAAEEQAMRNSEQPVQALKEKCGE